jgi:broad specificity phosphatase PhoE|uniref:histidine phosphatase family protein n=1 Tax=Candidatus Limnocylindrus sp. TaxID=2802978 RepID=UPI0040498A73
MSEPRLYLVRHGESEANVAGVLQGQTHGALTAAGRDAAARLGRALASLSVAERPTAILTSDLRRAVETAEIIAEALGATPHLFPAAREWNVGVLDGLPAAALVDAIQHSGLRAEEFVPSGGESLSQLQARAVQTLAGLAHKAADGEHVAGRARTLLVSHGDFIRMAIGAAASMAIDEANSLKLRNTSLSEFTLSNGAWRVERIGDTSHLDE